MSRLRALILLSALVLLVFAGLPVPASAQTPAASRKQAQASRAMAGAIKLDGHLDESIWQAATPLTDFLQAEPNENGQPTDRMEVRILYDETAVWIGARMFSANPDNIQAPMSRRDDGGQAEYIQVELDTYLDRRTAYMFGVTASGVRLDHFHPTDNEDDTDNQFEPVWEAKTSLDDGGWTAEMWLPFSQLRFNDAPERIWGLNIKRWRPALNEEDFWVVVGRTQRGWSSRFGDLRGIEGVRPHKRLELLPYVASSARHTANRDPNNPYDDGVNLTGRVGTDVKVGIGPNFTLDATFNPDFGQIEADPAEVNLTVFETTFAERRPFFIEGSSVLEAGTNNYYYSRRIGARPTGSATGTYVDYPDESTILGAAKLTGRTRKGLSLGFLAALTAEENAKVTTASVESKVPVAPQSAWGVVRAIQEIGTGGNTAGAHLTVLHRNLEATDVLATLLDRNAITGGLDTRVRFKDRTYETAFNIGITHVDGEPASIDRIQRSSGHYFQRLDQPDIRENAARRSLTGTQIQGSINKIAGRHWLWGYNLMIESPEFHPLDFGRLNYAGDYAGGPRVTYRETRPGRIFRSYSFQTSLSPYWFFDSDLGARYSIGESVNATWRNFWSTSFSVTQYTRGNDPQFTRGGPSGGVPLGRNYSASLRNNNAATTRWNGGLSVRTNEFGEVSWSTNASLSSRPSPSLQFSISPEYSNDDSASASFQGPYNRQYITTISGTGRPDTYNNRYIFGLVDRTTISTQFRVSYVFKPDVTLDVYAEPFAASGHYRGFGELLATRLKDLRLYGTDGTTIVQNADLSYTVTDGSTTFNLSNRDFNTRSFRSNVVLKWEWRPGSTLYAVWQQNRGSSTATGEHVGFNDLFGSLKAAGDNIFAIKTTFWFSP